MARLELLQHWRGWITEGPTTDDAFWARLETVVGQNRDIEACILKSWVDVPPKEYVLGHLFNWYIYSTEDGEGESWIEFDSPPIWNAEELRQIEEISASLTEFFGKTS